MSKLPILSIAAGALAFGISAPAQAATSAQLAVSNSTQSNVACPVTLQLNGVVTGPPNVPFEYWFETTRNGVHETTGKVAALMPPTGVAPIGGSITIGESTDAAKENHVQVQAANVGQRSPALSNVATFAITCRSRYLTRSGAVTADSRPAPRASRGPVSADPVIVPTPTPTPQRSATRVQPAAPLSAVKVQPTPAPIVPAPTGLQSTLDSQVCADHAGFAGFICLGSIPAGLLTLVWDWAPSAQFGDLDGYRIYRVDSGLRTAVGYQNVTGVTLQAFEKPASGFAGQCFAVSAYKGATESALSNPFCAAGGSVTQKETFRAISQRQSMDVLSSTRLTESGTIAGLSVGFYHKTAKHDLEADYWENGFRRVGLLYDLAKLEGKSIFKAVLRLQVDTANVGVRVPYPGPIGGLSYYNYGSDHNTSCTTGISAGRDRWWTYSDRIAGSPPGVMYDTHGPDVDLDVTAIVKRWSSKADTNFGFVLYGSSEDLHAFTEAACETKYLDGATLDVTYF